jgi:hypothetical protein
LNVSSVSRTFTAGSVESTDFQLAREESNQLSAKKSFIIDGSAGNNVPFDFTSVFIIPPFFNY